MKATAITFAPSAFRIHLPITVVPATLATSAALLVNIQPVLSPAEHREVTLKSFDAPFAIHRHDQLRPLIPGKYAYAKHHADTYFLATSMYEVRTDARIQSGSPRNATKSLCSRAMKTKTRSVVDVPRRVLSFARSISSGNPVAFRRTWGVNAPCACYAMPIFVVNSIFRCHR